MDSSPSASTDLPVPRKDLPVPWLIHMVALTTGLTVASNYFNQPLLPIIAEDLHLSPGQVGAIPAVAQMAYALGLLLIVPLGDLLERRGLITALILVAAGGLFLTALSTSLPMILAGTAITGLASVVAQVLIPFMATLAAPEDKGKIVGKVMGGLLLGILLGRTAAGALADLGSWRTVFWLGACLFLPAAVMFRRALPRYHTPAGLSYLRLVWSVVTLFRDEPSLKFRAFLGACAFGSFSALWTTMAFLLAGPPYGYSPGAISLFGLAAAAGALAANGAGRLVDRGRGAWVAGAGSALLLLSWVPLAFGKVSLAAFILGVLGVDLALQAININNQAEIYRNHISAKSRLNAAYMTCCFLGSTAGAMGAVLGFVRFGWSGVVALGALLGGAGLLTLSRILVGARRPSGGIER